MKVSEINKISNQEAVENEISSQSNPNADNIIDCIDYNTKSKLEGVDDVICFGGSKPQEF